MHRSDVRGDDHELWRAAPLPLLLDLRRFQRRLERDLDGTVRALALSFAQYEIMEALAARPKLHAGELGRILGESRQAAHRLLLQLERGSLIDLLPSDEGLRGAHLTDAGERRLRLARGTLASLLERLASVPREERLTLLDTQRTLERALGEPVRGWWFD